MIDLGICNPRKKERKKRKRKSSDWVFVRWQRSHLLLQMVNTTSFLVRNEQVEAVDNPTAAGPFPGLSHYNAKMKPRLTTITSLRSSTFHMWFQDPHADHSMIARPSWMTSRSSQTLRSRSGPTHKPQPNSLPPLSCVFQILRDQDALSEAVVSLRTWQLFLVRPQPQIGYLALTHAQYYNFSDRGNVDDTKIENTLSVTVYKIQPLFSGVLLVRFQNEWFEQRVVRDTTNAVLFVECRPLSQQIEAIDSDWLNSPDLARGCNEDLIWLPPTRASPKDVAQEVSPLSSSLSSTSWHVRPAGRPGVTRPLTLQLGKQTY